MDILTQGLLGGVLAQTVAKKEDTKLATFIGMFAGLIADADIFIASSNDPLLNIEFHRHFTHSIFFIPLGALVAMAVLWPFMHKKLANGRLYLYCLMGYSLSGFLDACTSYGTHLFWPLLDERVSFNIISIIDPVFTLILIVALVVTFRKKTQQVARLGLVLSLCYLLLGVIQHNRAINVAEELAMSRGHKTVQHVLKPTVANNFLWRSVYIADNKIYVDAIRLGWFTENRIFAGESVDKFNIEQFLPADHESTVLYKDIQRFTRFSNGYIAIDKTQANVLGDIRYSMLPISAKPLWGIVLDKNRLQQHADYQFFRDNSAGIKKQFLDMLLLRN